MQVSPLPCCLMLSANRHQIKEFALGCRLKHKRPQEHAAPSFLCCSTLFSAVNEQIMQKSVCQLFACNRDNKSSDDTEKEAAGTNISRTHRALCHTICADSFQIINLEPVSVALSAVKHTYFMDVVVVGARSPIYIFARVFVRSLCIINTRQRNLCTFIPQ